MRIARLLGVVSVLAAATLSVKAEALNPTMKVNLPYTVTVGSQQLSPGEYVIREISHLSNVFGIYKNDGRTLETYVHLVPTEQLNASPQTDLVLRNDGHEYVMDQLWFEGQTTGFQFINPDVVKSRQQERSSVQGHAIKSGL